MPSALLRAVRALVLCGCAATGFAWADDAADIERLFRAGQTAQALQQLDALLVQRPKDAELRFLRGVLLSELHRTAEAIDAFAALSADYPELPEPYNNLAVVYAAEGEYDKARAALETALRAQPAYAVARQNLGDVYVQLARQSYAQALALEPANTAIPPKLALLRQLPLGIATPPTRVGAP